MSARRRPAACGSSEDFKGLPHLHKPFGPSAAAPLRCIEGRATGRVPRSRYAGQAGYSTRTGWCLRQTHCFVSDRAHAPAWVRHFRALCIRAERRRASQTQVDHSRRNDLPLCKRGIKGDWVCRLRVGANKLQPDKPNPPSPSFCKGGNVRASFLSRCTWRCPKKPAARGSSGVLNPEDFNGLPHLHKPFGPSAAAPLRCIEGRAAGPCAPVSIRRPSWLLDPNGVAFASNPLLRF